MFGSVARPHVSDDPKLRIAQVAPLLLLQTGEEQVLHLDADQPTPLVQGPGRNFCTAHVGLGRIAPAVGNLGNLLLLLLGIAAVVAARWHTLPALGLRCKLLVGQMLLAACLLGGRRLLLGGLAAAVGCYCHLASSSARTHLAPPALPPVTKYFFDKLTSLTFVLFFFCEKNFCGLQGI